MNALVTSEARIPVAENQEVDFEMLTNMGLLAQGSLDNLIANCIGSGIGYTGLACAIKTNSKTNSATLISVGQGWMKRGGKAYSLRDAADVDLGPIIGTVPSGKTAIVLILADGQEAPIEEQLTVLDAAKEPTDPNAYWPTKFVQGDSTIVRSVIPTRVGGTPDLQPQPPAANPGFCLLATCVVDNGSILSCTQKTGQQIVPQEQLATVMAALSSYQATLPAIINGLLSGVAANTLAIKGLAAQLQAAIIDLQNQINALGTRTTSSPGATFRGSDNFVDLSQSNPAATGYSAVVSGGLRFARVAAPAVPLLPTAPYDASLQQGTGALIYPTYVENDLGVVGSSYSPDIYGVTAKITNYQPWPSALLRRGFGRARVRVGINLQAVQANQVLATGDPSQLFAIDPTTFVYDPTWGDWRANNPTITRRLGYWFDISSRGYWTPVEGIGDTAGQAAVSQAYRPQTTCMVTKVKASGRNAGGGPVRLLIMGDVNGNPDPTHVLADVVTNVVPFNGSFVSYPTWVLPCPILQKAGDVYHYVFLSNDSFEFLTYTPGSGSSPPGMDGGVQAIVNGAWASVSALTSLAISLQRAQFTKPNIIIPLPNLNLAGGADTIDLLSKLILPDGCSFDYQVQVGGQWVSLSQVTGSTNPLAGNPNTLPLRLVLSGTSAVAPIIDTSPSVGQLYKSNAALDHISAVQAPAAPVTTIHKTVVIDNWQPNVQTLTANLRTGAGYATNTAPTSVSPDVIQADGSLIRTYTWALGAAVPSFEMELIGTTTDVSKTFVGRSSSWDAA